MYSVSQATLPKKYCKHRTELANEPLDVDANRVRAPARCF
jgi:hypothetical protein